MYWGHKERVAELQVDGSLGENSKESSLLLSTHEVSNEDRAANSHAGTANYPLGEIDFDALYKGR